MVKVPDLVGQRVLAECLKLLTWGSMYSLHGRHYHCTPDTGPHQSARINTQTRYARSEQFSCDNKSWIYCLVEILFIRVVYCVLCIVYRALYCACCRLVAVFVAVYCMLVVVFVTPGCTLVVALVTADCMLLRYLLQRFSRGRPHVRCGICYNRLLHVLMKLLRK